MSKKDNKQKAIERRHKIVYAIVIAILRFVFKVFRNYRCARPVKIDGPVIVLCNHCTDYDAILLTSGFRKQMYFIASENCFRKGLKSKFLVWAFGPISKIKGAADTLAVMKAIRYLKEGKNIALFPELTGRTFNGKTTPVTTATGKLVKISGATLATFKISGAYFKNPRWGYGTRKGKWSGKVMGIYPAEDLKKMTPQEITDIVNRDLYENAYETQAKNPSKYKTKTPALGMECALCVCPKCRTIGQIKTDATTVFCQACGIKTTIDDYGYFEKDFPVHSVVEWDEWQEEFYKNYTASFDTNEKPIVFDDNVSLKTFNSNHETNLLGTGRFSLFKDRFQFDVEGKEPVILPVDKVPDCSVFSRSNFNFTDSDGLHYELNADRLINVRKYASVWSYLRK